MTDALVARGLPEPTAQIAAESGVLAFKRGIGQWVNAGDAADLAPYLADALDVFREAVASLG